MKYIYSYTLGNESHDLFVDAIRKIDAEHPDFVGGYGVGNFGRLEQCDYKKGDDYITLTNDYDIGAVYIDSTVELKVFDRFRNRKYENEINNQQAS